MHGHDPMTQQISAPSFDKVIQGFTREGAFAHHGHLPLYPGYFPALAYLGQPLGIAIWESSQMLSTPNFG